MRRRWLTMREVRAILLCGAGSIAGTGGISNFRLGADHRHADRMKESAGVHIAATTDRQLNLETKDLGCVSRTDFWEDRVVLETECVVTLSIELVWQGHKLGKACLFFWLIS